MKLLEIQDHKGLARDIESRAVVNTDSKAYRTYLEKKNLALSRKEEFSEMKAKLENLEALVYRLLAKLEEK